MPERLVRLMFCAGQTYVGDPAGTLVALPSAYLIGMQRGPLRAVSLGKMWALGAELYPWAARQLLSWKDGAGGVEVLSGHGQVVREVHGLLTLERWDEARQTVEAWLLDLAGVFAREHGRGVLAATRLYGSFGSARIAALADELSLSPRQLERQFRAEVGVSAKTLARLIRFSEAHDRLLAQPEVPLAALAYDLGFADQAHLTRDFRALSHLTPGAFARASRWRSQDGGPADLDFERYMRVMQGA